MSQIVRFSLVPRKFSQVFSPADAWQYGPPQ